MQVAVAEINLTFTLGYNIEGLFVIKLLNDQMIWLYKHGLHSCDNGLDDSFFCLLLSEGRIGILNTILLGDSHDRGVNLRVVLHDIVKHLDANSLFQRWTNLLKERFEHVLFILRSLSRDQIHA